MPDKGGRRARIVRFFPVGLVQWTGRHVAQTAALFLVIALIFFVWLNVASGPIQEIRGTVQSVGMDTGTVFTLSRVVATVQTEEGRLVPVEIPDHAAVTTGTKVVLEKRSRLLTGGYEYKFSRMANDQ